MQTDYKSITTTANETYAEAFTRLAIDASKLRLRTKIQIGYCIFTICASYPGFMAMRHHSRFNFELEYLTLYSDGKLNVFSSISIGNGTIATSDVQGNKPGAGTQIIIYY